MPPVTDSQHSTYAEDLLAQQCWGMLLLSHAHMQFRTVDRLP